MAPEVLRGKYNEKCDVWSCGVILYILLCGWPPFDGPNEKAIMNKVAIGHYSFDEPEWLHVSDDAKKLIKKLLKFEPAKRISAERALNDPWIKNHVAAKEIDRPIAISQLTNLKTFRVNSNKMRELNALIIRLVASCRKRHGYFW